MKRLGGMKESLYGLLHLSFREIDVDNEDNIQTISSYSLMTLAYEY